MLFADKGYDADFIREDMERRGGTAMIPTERNRLVQLPVDAAIYALRNMVERCFNKLKNARRLATRYDKTADSYLGFIHIVSIRLWTRQFVNASYVFNGAVSRLAASRRPSREAAVRHMGRPQTSGTASFSGSDRRS